MVHKTVLKEKVTGESFASYIVYGPYQNMKGLWESFFSSGLLELKNVILGGYLNITLSEKENWGATIRQDSLSSFFDALFESKELVDLQPMKLTPTRRNNRCG